MKNENISYNECIKDKELFFSCIIKVYNYFIYFNFKKIWSKYLFKRSEMIEKK